MLTTLRRLTPTLTCFCALFLCAVGCTVLRTSELAPGSVVEPGAPQTALERAETLYNEGDYGAALIACVELAHKDPFAPGLAELRNKIMVAVVELRAKRAAMASEVARNRMAVEAAEKEGLPTTYGLRKFIRGDNAPLRTPGGPMAKALEAPVTIHLKAANLSAFIGAIARDRNVNIIADKGLGKGESVDIDVEDVPLVEVLDYISRNMGVRFLIGKNVIWATDPAKAESGPMETRLYRLRKGLQFHGGDWQGGKQPAKLPHLTNEATELSDGLTYLENTLKRFLPPTKGADLHLDRNTHVLIIRDTRENLALAEELIAALDVTPPQVLIEARFVETTVSDLRELGIDWILDGPLVTSQKYVMQNGALVRAPQTQIEAGDVVRHVPYGTGTEGPFPLGPQGAFGLREEEGNLPTADQGLNIAFHGILTDPEFRAVLHALDISGKGRILSVPRVTTVNNNPAKLRNGEDLNYFQEFQAQAFSLRDENNKRFTVTVLIPKGKPTTEETGITLIAVPSVGADMRTVSLLLMPTISRVERWTSYQAAPGTNEVDAVRQVVVKLPVISRKEVQTKVIVESGETVVLGGLIDTITQDTLHTVPFLGSIPLLGRLFERRDTTEQKRNLLIFVTAKVISERGETLVPY